MRDDGVAHREEPELPFQTGSSTNLGASFRDPSGFLFTRNGQLYRQINASYQKDYERLIETGLYQKLVSAGWLIPHQEVPVTPADTQLAYRVIQPEALRFISYPYEWSFSQLKDAALATLEIQKIALDYGMSLKDASAFNIQFHRGRPTLIDTLSFEAYPQGKPWIAYRQFCQHFLAPLSLMAYRDVRLGQLLRVYIDGLPLDLVSKLLPARSWLALPLLLHIHLHAASQRRYAGQAVATSRQVSRLAFQGLIDSLESGIRRLDWKPTASAWADYYSEHNYTSAGLERKKQLVSEYLDWIQPHSVWDLGANTGLFSRLASERGIPTLALDIDPAAVEINYRECQIKGEENLLPLLMDLTNPSPALGWQHQERSSWLDRGPAEAALALALVHHLAIANNVPLDHLADLFHQASRWLVIEFVPKSDSQVRRLLVSRADIFPNYSTEGFEAAFSRKYFIHRRDAIPDSERCLYLMEKR